MELARVVTLRRCADAVSIGYVITPTEKRKMTWTVVVGLADEG
jgi:hypothetical protein